MSQRSTDSENAGVHATPVGEAEMKALTEAFQQFTHTTQLMEESYRRLEARLESLDRELQEKNRTLELTTDYLNSLLESMSDGVIAVDTDGTITTFNRAASRILGFSADEIVGTPYGRVFGQPLTLDAGARTADLPRHDGSVVTVSVRNSPLADRAGATSGTVTVFQDLTEIEALREQVRRKDRLAAIGEMAATVAHEIRNPLGGIRGFAALLERDIEEGDPRARLVQKIISGTKNLDRVVDELLEYTRPVELRVRDVGCAQLVDNAIAYLDVPADTLEIRNTVDAALHVRVDPDKMRQVLLNILLNAVQSLPNGGRVTVSADCGAQGATLSIADTGGGIAPDDMEKVFSPFYTTKEKGTGLGLAVAAKTVESHGGRIYVESAPGKGATFSIFLPNGN